MTTATKQTIPTDQLWRDVQLADERRQVVRARIDAVAEQIGAAGKRLAEATEDDREEIRSELAGLTAEAAVLPVEFVAASNPYATALHHWAKGSLEDAQAIERKARGAANTAFAQEADDLQALDQGENSLPRKRREAREKVKADRTAINLRTAATAERAMREAAEKAKPIRRRVCDLVRPIFGSPRRIGRTEEAIGELVDGCLTGHERWLENERMRVEKILAGRGVNHER